MYTHILTMEYVCNECTEPCMNCICKSCNSYYMHVYCFGKYIWNVPVLVFFEQVGKKVYGHLNKMYESCNTRGEFDEFYIKCPVCAELIEVQSLTEEKQNTLQSIHDQYILDISEQCETRAREIKEELYEFMLNHIYLWIQKNYGEFNNTVVRGLSFKEED